MTYPVNTNLAYNQILQAHDLQQQLTAQNIANVNTPSYKAKEVNLGETFAQVLRNERNVTKKRISISTTSTMHINGAKFGNSTIQISNVFGEEKANGNNVNLSEETLRASKNEVDRSIALKEYDALNRLVTLSIGSRG